jgi:hypothetical protein
VVSWDPYGLLQHLEITHSASQRDFKNIFF